MIDMGWRRSGQSLHVALLAPELFMNQEHGVINLI